MAASSFTLENLNESGEQVTDSWPLDQVKTPPLAGDFSGVFGYDGHTERKPSPEDSHESIKGSDLAFVTIAGLALIAAGVGLLAQSAGSSFSFTTVRGVTVQIYGQGWYHLDTPIAAVGFMAADIVTLVVAIPLLVISTLLYRRGSQKGGLLLSGTLAYFLYNYGSVAYGSMYNNLFLVYVAIFSASLFGLIVVLTSFDVSMLPNRFSARLPRRGISLFLIVSGMILMLVWLVLSIVPALLQGTAPLEAAFYTTFTTAVIDIAIVAPALIVAGVLLRRHAPIGYLLAPMLLVFTVTLGLNLMVAGIAAADRCHQHRPGPGVYRALRYLDVDRRRANHQPLSQFCRAAGWRSVD
jgi:hypothetical protein